MSTAQHAFSARAMMAATSFSQKALRAKRATASTIQTTKTEEEKKKLKKKKTIKKRATTIENEGEGRTKTNRSRPTAATTAPSSLYTARRTGTICSPPRKTAPAVCGIARAASASKR